MSARRRLVLGALAVVAAIATGVLSTHGTAAAVPPPQDAAAKSQVVLPPAPADTGNLLRLLGIVPSDESIDYVRDKTQFQLHTLLTEQRHPRTWTLGERAGRDAAAALRMIFGVDEDVRAKLEAMAADPSALAGAARAVEDAVASGRKVYVYGCGATGRLAKQMESTFWRPFWRKVVAGLGSKARKALPAGIEDALVGEMTGGDRALISSLEGFEDLQLIGRLQLQDHGIRRGDVVICVTEGGETSSVIGTALGALDQWKAEPGGYDPGASRRAIYFIYNNPDDRLMPFARSRSVLEEPGITKINLTTGPQAITGSTRMQATTIETFVVAAILEDAARGLLARAVSLKELARLGFAPGFDIAARLRSFGPVLAEVQARAADLGALTEAEAAVYKAGRFTTYFAEDALITVFIDSTERSPTFRLFPLDTVREPERKCWIQVWTDASDRLTAWRSFLGRPFRGLDPALYREPFERDVEDAWLRQAALSSLTRAGSEQQELYDFSMSEENLAKRAPRAGDLGVAVAFGEETGDVTQPGSAFAKFARLCADGGAGLFVLAFVDDGPAGGEALRKALGRTFGANAGRARVVAFTVPGAGDPLGIRRQVAAKIVLNAHSTAVMARLGKVVGNTMTNVSPSNLKLVGRATFLIQSHVNDALSRPGWVSANGRRSPITYGEANAVLFDAIQWIKSAGASAAGGQPAEVAVSIVRILESLRERRGLTDDEAFEIVRTTGLAAFLDAIR